MLVKHLGKAGKLNDPDTFEIIMATPEGVWHLSVHFINLALNLLVWVI